MHGCISIANGTSREAWKQWARSAVPDRITAGKTTMLIEAHWKVLKQNHLYRFNRARLDLLVFVIIDRYFPDLRHKYNLSTVQSCEAIRVGEKIHCKVEQSISRDRKS